MAVLSHFRMSSVPRELFAVAPEEQIQDWGALVRELEKQEPSLLGLWKEEYEHWKNGYLRFRGCEEQAFFTVGGDHQPRILDDQILRFHKRAILALWASGEKCETHLSQLPLEDPQDAQDRLVFARRVRTLLDSLRESLDLWHPANAERSAELRKMASK